MRDIAQLLERWQLDVGNLRKACKEHQHLVSGSVGMGYGCWPKGGRRSKWLRLWRERLIPLETGWPTFAEPGPKVWSLNRLGVPPRLEPG